MEKGALRNIPFALALVICFLITASSFATTGSGVNRVVDILFEADGARETITIVTERDVDMTSVPEHATDRVVLEATELDPGIFGKEILIEGALVSRLVPTVGAGTTRFELVLSKPAGHRVEVTGHTVIVTVDPSLAATAPVVEMPGLEIDLAADLPELNAADAIAGLVVSVPVVADQVSGISPALEPEPEPLSADQIVVEAAAPVIVAQAEMEEPAAAAAGPMGTREPDAGAATRDVVVDQMDAARVYDMRSPAGKYKGKPISLDFKEMDIRDVFITIAQVSGFNIVLDPDVSGTITIRLDKVPWDQALDVILKNQGLDKEIDGNVMRIANMTKLRDERVLLRQMEEAKERIRPRETRIVYLSYAKTKDIAGLAGKMLSGRGDIITDPRTNSLIVVDVPESIDKVIRLVKILDVRTKQVYIDAQLVTTSKDFSRSLGIQWGGNFVADAAHGNTTGYRFPNNYTVGADGGEEDGYAVNFPGGDQILNLQFGNIMDTLKLRMALSTAESEGITKIISNPRVTTADNTTANIESGVQLPYSTVSAEGTQTNFVSATLRLAVTPHVTHEGYISMDVETNKNAPDYSNSSASGTPILTNSASTQVLIRDGDTLVIGGLNESTFGDSQSRIPLIHQIPVLGWLFKNKIKNSKFTDLLIFITPQVLEWGEQVPVTGQF
ncbi:type IV pilus secretin PilQ [bacterium]|nr:type IV pilus secretin PilQ [candidate division CSSED10-310 bacterium]